MIPANDTGAEAAPNTPPLAAARTVEGLLSDVRNLMLHAASAAEGGGLSYIAEWLCARVDNLEGTVMSEVRLAVEALEAETHRR
jgi:hypothetical protein